MKVNISLFETALQIKSVLYMYNAMLIITFIVSGIGFGFIYVPSIITIGFYFERWRALATGIAVCGSGIGTFAFAPLSEILITHLGWRGALLFQGGLVLSCFIFGMLFR